MTWAPDVEGETSSQRSRRTAGFAAVQQRVADRLHELRIARGWSFAKLERKSGVSLRHLYGLEQGKVNVTLVTLYRLAVGLEVDIEVLLSTRPASEQAAQ